MQIVALNGVGAEVAEIDLRRMTSGEEAHLKHFRYFICLIYEGVFVLVERTRGPDKMQFRVSIVNRIYKI